MGIEDAPGAVSNTKGMLLSGLNDTGQERKAGKAKTGVMGSEPDVAGFSASTMAYDVKPV
jgi:hypothetical protein